jgi:nitrile hydratase beta subunit
VNGIHDIGGMHGFGPVVRELAEPVFHAEWERRTFAMVLAMLRCGSFNIDEFRRTIEQMPPLEYLGASYYERWLHACESLLIEKGIVVRVEIDVVREALRAIPSTPAAPVCTSDQGGPVSAPDQMATEAEPAKTLTTISIPLGGARALRHDASFNARFKAGDRVIARNLNPLGHTRIPRYVRGHHGIIHRDWGVFVFPDTHAHGLGANPQHCYGVQFDAHELWGGDHPAGDRVYVDLWEDYLDVDLAAVAIDAKPRTNGSHKTATASPVNAHAIKPARKRIAKKSRSRKTPQPANGNQGKNHQGMTRE